jgi:hypothetical protein
MCCVFLLQSNGYLNFHIKTDYTFTREYINQIFLTLEISIQMEQSKQKTGLLHKPYDFWYFLLNYFIFNFIGKSALKAFLGQDQTPFSYEVLVAIAAGLLSLLVQVLLKEKKLSTKIAISAFVLIISVIVRIFILSPSKLS